MAESRYMHTSTGPCLDLARSTSYIVSVNTVYVMVQAMVTRDAKVCTPAGEARR